MHDVDINYALISCKLDLNLLVAFDALLTERHVGVRPSASSFPAAGHEPRPCPPAHPV